VALYEDGTYLDRVGGDVFLRLMKEPSAFSLQYCALEGIRHEVFVKLLKLLDLPKPAKDASDLLDLVRPLMMFVAREVNDYTRKTNHLPARVIAVRNALLQLREPIRLVFTALPEACGMPAISANGKSKVDIEEFAARLESSLQAVRVAYPGLLKRIEKAIIAAFTTDEEYAATREMIGTRAKQLAATVTEPQLKAFCNRLADTTFARIPWLESLGNLLARKSPERWDDSDETEFMNQIEIWSARFKRTELTLVGTTRKLNGHACRIALTKSDGTEVGHLVDWNGLDEAKLKKARGDVEDMLDRLGDHGMAAAAEILWNRFDAMINKKQRKL
jgi:hypothetical protein